MSTKARRRLAAGASVIAAALVVASCGTVSGSGASSVPPSFAPVNTAPGTGGAGRQAITNYQSYTDGSSGKANSSLPPVYIGWINQQGGSQQIGPLATNGVELAVNYVNSALGGVDGHPVKLETCYVVSTAKQAAACGRQFATDNRVSVIDYGALGIGTPEFYSALGGSKPVIGGVTFTPTDSVQKNAVILFGDVTHVLGPFGTYAEEVLHAKTAAVVYPDIAGISYGAAAIVASLKAAGLSVKQVGFPESETNLIWALTKAGAQTADIVVPYSDSSACVNLAKSLQALGITEAVRIVSAPLCLNSQVQAANGGDYPIWTYAIASSLYNDPTDPAMAPYENIAKAYGDTTDAPDPWNIVGFSQVMTTVRFLNELGYGHITPSAVLAEAKSFSGPVALGAPSLSCGEFPSAPAVCNDRTQFFLYYGDGTFAKTTNWLQPPS